MLEWIAVLFITCTLLNFASVSTTARDEETIVHFSNSSSSFPPTSSTSAPTKAYSSVWSKLFSKKSITDKQHETSNKQDEGGWFSKKKPSSSENMNENGGLESKENHHTNGSAASSKDHWTNIPVIGHITHGLIMEIQNHVHIIKPGTKWCGDGNKARSYQDIGVFYKTDSCCRDHDKCSMYISAGQSKYGLYNDAPWTRSHCDCDAAFYTCLKSVNSPFAAMVGYAYFNVLKMKCFKFEFPVVMCVHMTNGWFSKQCTQYVVDMSKEKRWQWFDNYEY